MLPVIRDNLDLTKTDIGNAGIAAVVGAIASRIAMGGFVDSYGPRFGIALCIGVTAPAVYCIGLATNAIGFIISRFFIGFSLATFVACQFWCTSMFNTRIVGTANAFAAGWVSCCCFFFEGGERGCALGFFVCACARARAPAGQKNVDGARPLPPSLPAHTHP